MKSKKSIFTGGILGLLFIFVVPMFTANLVNINTHNDMIEEFTFPSLPKNSGVRGELDTPGLAKGIAVDGNFAYIADDTSGVHIIDISGPLHPVNLSTSRIPGQTSAQRRYIIFGEW
jgi:hypothetical protein